MLLKIGSKGEDVKSLQSKLSISSDGSFGPGTEKAVKDWQNKNGFTADGIVTEKMWNVLFPTVASTTNVSNASYGFIDKLKGKVADNVYGQLSEACTKFNINSPLRLAHFMAQCSHESGSFKAVSENLNYSSKGLLGTFGKYFDASSAASYEKKPEKIASRVYANRMGNGDEASGEGWKFRGRGYIQLTGKQNYQKFTQFIGEDCVANPDLVATKYPLASAAFFFDSNKLWSICDKGADDATVTAVTKRVNGGTLGLADRIKHFKEFYHLLS